MVKLKASLPPGDLNGLEAILTDALLFPTKFHMVIGGLACSEIRENIRIGSAEPIFQLTHIEPLAPCLTKQGHALLSKAMELRLPPSLFGEDWFQDYLSKLIETLEEDSLKESNFHPSGTLRAPSEGSLGEHKNNLLELRAPNGD